MLTDAAYRNRQKIRAKTRHLVKIGALKQNGVCYLCGFIGETQIHHVRYDRADQYFEVCKNCHREIHKRL